MNISGVITLVILFFMLSILIFFIKNNKTVNLNIKRINNYTTFFYN